MSITPSRRLTVALVGTVVGALALSSCVGETPPRPDSAATPYELTATTPEPTGDIDTFTWSLYAEPVSLAYTYAFDYPPNTVLSNMCESLVRWNPDLTLSPGLASAWTNPTPTTWVFSIRDGVTFHDGSTLTADDVVASLSRHLDPAVGSYWSRVYSSVESIQRTGDLEVTVTTKSPIATFDQSMAGAPGVIESAATLAAAGADYGNPTTGVNCTGPFAFDSWTPGQDITLKRFDGYWDPQLAAKSAEVKFVFLQDPSTMVNAFATGEVDGGWMVPPTGIDQLKSSGAGDVYFGVNTTTLSLIASNLSGALQDVRVRQSLLMAIDRKGIVATGEAGYGEVTDSLTPRSVWVNASSEVTDDAFASFATYDYDLEAAKKLAAEAGVDGQKLVIATSPLAPALTIAAQAVAAGATAIGLKPEIRTISPDQYGALFGDPAAREGIDIFPTSWYLSAADPQDMIQVLRSTDSSNYGGWSNAKYDALAEAGAQEFDVDARAALSGQALAIASEELPWLPLYDVPTSVFLGKRITGVAPSIDFLYYPWAASIGAAG